MVSKGLAIPSLISQCLVGLGQEPQKWQEMLCAVTKQWLTASCPWLDWSAGYQVSPKLKRWPFSLWTCPICLYTVLCLFWAFKQSADKLMYLSSCPQWDLCLVFQRSLQWCSSHFTVLIPSYCRFSFIFLQIFPGAKTEGRGNLCCKSLIFMRLMMTQRGKILKK